MPVPILLIGDHPGRSTGLARILRDLASLLYANRAALDVEVSVLGLGDEEGEFPWKTKLMRDREEFGADDLPKAWWALYGNRRGVVMTIWDAGRCFRLSETAADSPVQLWGYFPVDSTNIHGCYSGPPAIAIKRYRRVLAYGPWGSGVLRRTLGRGVPWLPHGLDLGVWTRSGDPAPLVGCVAANQPRKDYGLLFHAWRMLADRDASLKFWLHTDDPVVKHWSVPQLAEDFALEDRLVVTTPESLGSDADLAAMYSQCLVTIAPGLGEGWGYPIAESLACGVPVVHVDHAGGAGLVPLQEWKFSPRVWRLESAFAQLRPVCEPYDVTGAAIKAIEWRRAEPEVVAEYCRGSVEAFSWRNLAGYWTSWFAQGLVELREI